MTTFVRRFLRKTIAFATGLSDLSVTTPSTLRKRASFLASCFESCAAASRFCSRFCRAHRFQLDREPLLRVAVVSCHALCLILIVLCSDHHFIIKAFRDPYGEFSSRVRIGLPAKLLFIGAPDAHLHAGERQGPFIEDRSDDQKAEFRLVLAATLGAALCLRTRRRLSSLRSGSRRDSLTGPQCERRSGKRGKRRQQNGHDHSHSSA